MPKAPKIPHSSADDTKKYHCDCERLCKGQLREGTCSLKEKRTHAGMASSAVQRASQGHSTIEENHLADYDDFGNIPNTAPDVHPPISPPRHVIPQRSPSPDPLLPQPNDSGVPAPLDTVESKDTKIKGKKSCDPSLALEASRSSSSKHPTSLTVLQSEHTKKQRVLLADGTSESSESISTSITMKKPVPASQPALQFLSMFNNTGARDAVSNTSPGSHSVDEVLQSQPMHVQVSTGSSSDSAQSSGESVTPLSDSVPLPSSSTLAFLATALNNASLEGSTSPHISLPSATSTGEVLTQPVKKKRGPTNPNNVFKPSLGSTTMHNLCGIEWQAQRKTETVAEFTAHWNSLTLQQREPYIARSKLADAAKTNAAEFAVSGP
ncbi:hypothetical protein F4604DRAFT_1801599 [Suillus subluteus]|nr:hypothetical protein F4604DRAFT_1801599 [Suillus subluteus]